MKFNVNFSSESWFGRFLMPIIRLDTSVRFPSSVEFDRSIVKFFKACKVWKTVSNSFKISLVSGV